MEKSTTSTLLEPAVAVSVAPPSPAGFSPARFWHRIHGASPFASNVALTVTTNGFIALAGLVTGPLCARLLGPAGRGELAAIQNLFWFVGILAMLGMPEATLYFTARQKNEGGRILLSATTLVLLVAPLFLLAVYRFVPVLLAAQSPSLIKTATWFLLGIPLYALCTVPVFALRGANHLVRWNILRLVPTFGWLVLLLGLRRFAVPTPKMVAIGYLVVLAATIVPTFMLVRKGVPGKFKFEPKRWPGLLKYGIPLAGAAIPFTLNVRLDQMIMAAFLPASSLGIYVVAVSWSGAVSPALMAIGTVLFPRVASADSANQGRLLAQGTRISLMIAVLLAIIVSALTPLAIPLLFGKAFAGSVVPGVLLVFAAAILGMNIVLEEGLRGLGLTASVFWGEAAGLTLTAASLLVLLRPLGILGAAVASIVGYTATAIYLLTSVNRRVGVTFADLMVPRLAELQLAWSRFQPFSRGRGQ